MRPPWETLAFSRYGVSHELRFKRRTGLMWRAAGAAQVVQLIVIAPLGYRLRKGSKLLYREPKSISAKRRPSSAWARYRSVRSVP